MTERVSTGLMRVGVVALSWAAPLLVILVIWLPLVAHYRVPTPRIDRGTIELLRQAPEDRLLDEIADSGLILTASAAPDDKVRIARGILDGRLDLPGEPEVRIGLPFDPAELERGSPSLQLQLAALIVPELLLEAYARTGDEAFFVAAREAVFAWAEYESDAWLPTGYLWNDHACAARVPVLIKFWRVYRGHPAYTAEGAARLMQAVERSAAMLVKPGHFTYRTNHGIMQNLALWQAALAFPSLPGADRYRQAAVARLTEQIEFYVNREGAVLEHSAGYHELGVSLLGLALRYASLSNIEAPAGWAERYDKARSLYTQLRRPDGTLPMFGDTLHRPKASIRVESEGGRGFDIPLATPQDWGEPAGAFLAPAAGIATWWDGLDAWPDPQGLRQTVVVWGDHPGRAHKHADETSVLLWAGGLSWWTNVGYWPYGDPNRKTAVSWPGSNAPHAVGEDCCARRDTRLLRELTADPLRVVDLLRTTDEGYAARRQVIHLEDDLWLVVDSVEPGAAIESRTIWTAFPGLVVADDPTEDSFVLSRPGHHPALLVTFLGSETNSVRKVRGSDQPFAGWIVAEQGVMETTALVVEMTGPAFAIAVWRLASGRLEAQPAAQPRLESWSGPEAWRVVVPAAQGELGVSRQGGRILVDLPGSADPARRFELGEAADVTAERARTERAYAALDSNYETFRDLLEYRKRATILVVFLFLAQELALLVLRRMTRVPTPGLRLAGIACWALVGAWLQLVYFV